MDRIEIAVGPHTFDAWADGPDGQGGQGDGELVLLLHGFPQTGWCWRNQLPVLAGAGYRAIATDQRGYSPRARPTEVEDYRNAALVGDVVGIADAVGAERFHLVGHDWGGAIAWQVAGRHAERVATLTVLSTPHPLAMGEALAGQLGGDQQARSGYFAVFREPGSEHGMLADGATVLRTMLVATGLPEDDAAVYVEALGTPEALGAALNWYRGADLTLLDGLGPITSPTLYVWSTEDVALGREAAEATGLHVPGPYRFEVLDGVSHWIAEQAPDRLTPLLLDHLGSASTSA
jgi:pimeloyl-ACP methyl ester carboxylesterase